MTSKKIIGLTVATALTAISISHISNNLRNSQLFMPKEYQSIKKIVNKLSKGNDLGDEPISFTIIAGHTSSYRASELNLCRVDQKGCYYFVRLNPYKTYSGRNQTQINEIIRQSKLYGGLEGFVDHELIINIGISAFHKSKHNKNDLACLLAHELNHHIEKTSFKEKLEAYEIRKISENEPYPLLEKQIRRESEVRADINGAKMLFNVGVPIHTCVKARKRWLQTNGYKIKAEEKDNYPGYAVWMEELHEFLAEHSNDTHIQKPEGTKIRWEYNRDLNELRLIPKKQT
tara:strand:+ start:135 stop:998 length:864 start_codon:yes stop_codon:yes gene_type:complete